MKKAVFNKLFISVLLAGLMVLGVTGVQAGQDTTRIKNRKYQSNIIFEDREDSLKNARAPKGRFIGGLTFTRIDWGFSKLIDNGSFNLSPDNNFLDYKAVKSSTFSVDLLHFGYRFNPNFKIYIAAGIDYTMIRLKNNITILENTPVLDYINEPVIFSKNRLSSNYIHFPLNFELRSKENNKGKRFYFVFGPEVAFLLNGKVKQISEERGKQKFRDDYNFQPVRLGGTVRLGYGGIGVFTKYYFNDMFDSAPQSGLKNMSFGLTLGIN